MKVINKYLALLFILNVSLLTQINIMGSYPLQVGNVFVFLKSNYNSSPPSNDSSYLRCIITNDTVISSKRYFRFNIFPLSNPNVLLRFDSLSGRLLNYDTTLNCSNYIHERLFDSVWAAISNVVRYCNNYKNYCRDTTPVILFGQSNYSRNLHWSVSGPMGFVAYDGRIYAKGFGLIFQETGSRSISGTQYTRYSLKGCLINGQLYGDTVNYLVGLVQTNTIIPNQYKLYSNYPNPFNPLTNIPFDIPEKTFVLLEIYNVTGQKIETLFNGNLDAGSYEFKWEAGTNCSGIYFYRLTTKEFMQTQKAMLIK
jgi:hypothetical protein